MSRKYTYQLVIFYHLCLVMSADYFVTSGKQWNTQAIKCLSNGHFPARTNYSKHVNIPWSASPKWTGITSFSVIRQFDRTYLFLKSAIYLLQIRK